MLGMAYLISNLISLCVLLVTLKFIINSFFSL